MAGAGGFLALRPEAEWHSALILAMHSASLTALRGSDWQSYSPTPSRAVLRGLRENSFELEQQDNLQEHGIQPQGNCWRGFPGSALGIWESLPGRAPHVLPRLTVTIRLWRPPPSDFCPERRNLEDWDIRLRKSRLRRDR